MATCYICFEPCEEQSKCECEAYVHQICLDEWMAKSGDRQCSICKGVFYEEIEEEPPKVPFCPVFCLAVALVLFLIAFLIM
jgi:E3 ubiquitin-protein ligase DOA10